MSRRESLGQPQWHVGYGGGWGKLTLETTDILVQKRLSRFTRQDAQSLGERGEARAADTGSWLGVLLTLT
jgi:hypothetical protein